MIVLKLKIRRTVYEDIELSPEEIITVKEAADLLEISMPGVIAAVNRGAFSEIIDVEALNPQKRRRFLLRSEIEARLMSEQETDS